jgi:PAS domain S-box-containing protein
LFVALLAATGIGWLVVSETVRSRSGATGFAVAALLFALSITLLAALLLAVARSRSLGAEVRRRRAAQAALTASEGQYRSLVEAAADGIFVNRGDRIVYANSALLRMLGAESAEQVLGKSAFEIIHPDCHSLVRERVRTILETGRPVPFVEEDYVRLDGTVVVESAPGKGTAFHIYLPLAEAPASAKKPPSSYRPAPRGCETVLLVEDEEGVRVLTRRMLEASGYQVLDTTLPQEAIRLCEERDGPIHLLVTDVVMPRMGGRELADRLTAGRPEMRVLFVSGDTDEQVVRYGVVRGENVFLHKPYAPAALARKVREVLDQSTPGPHELNSPTGGRRTW